MPRSLWRFVGAAAVAAVAACGSRSGPMQKVIIPKGVSFRVAAESLAAYGLIADARLFGIYAKIRGRDRTVRYGTYMLAKGTSWNELLEDLRRGKGIVHTVTIPEGYELSQIVSLLAQTLEVSRDSLEMAVRDSALRRQLDVPTSSLEGYLFPDTYTFPDQVTAHEAVTAMVHRFQEQWRPEWEARLDSLKLNRHDIVTLASIVEREVRRREEGPVVAAVYLNRLRTRMPLQADPTVTYALGKRPGRVYYRDLRVKSPYNTYRVLGLPPGPIGSPGLASLTAALHPAKVPYRFFVAHPDGHHEFRTTYREHLEAIRMVRAQASMDSATREANALRAARDSAARAAGAPLESLPPMPAPKKPPRR
ncbi:MAG: endolytic transglycosylase MltG [Gemmatimonadetes bacterium]|nr:endolytic transglycosylase MltG [Gemmatimonadota bacterium]